MDNNSDTNLSTWDHAELVQREYAEPIELVCSESPLGSTRRFSSEEHGLVGLAEWDRVEGWVHDLRPLTTPVVQWLNERA